jgi:starvation-inducible outer membrane lipoprotein
MSSAISLFLKTVAHAGMHRLMWAAVAMLAACSSAPRDAAAPSAESSSSQPPVIVVPPHKAIPVAPPERTTP